MEAFIFQKLLMGVGFTTLAELEVFETAILETLSPEQRYSVTTNCRLCTGGNNGFYRRQHGEDSRKILSESKTGKPSPFLGKTQSEQVRQKISQQNAGMSCKERRKGIYIGDTCYESISEASRITGYARRIIRERCHSQDPQFQHYKWAVEN